MIRILKFGCSHILLADFVEVANLLEFFFYYLPANNRRIITSLSLFRFVSSFVPLLVNTFPNLDQIPKALKEE